MKNLRYILPERAKMTMSKRFSQTVDPSRADNPSRVYTVPCHQLVVFAQQGFHRGIDGRLQTADGRQQQISMEMLHRLRLLQTCCLPSPLRCQKTTSLWQGTVYFSTLLLP